jgi:hypothetical protein
VLANTGIGDRCTATGHLPARRSGPELSEDTAHPKLEWFGPSKRDARSAKKADTPGVRATGVSFEGRAGCTPLWRLSAGQVVAVIHPDAGPSATKNAMFCGSPLVSGSAWISRASRLRSVHAAGCSNSLL